MEYVSVIAIENCSLVIRYEVVHADSAIYLIILFLPILLVNLRIDILEGVSSQSLYGTDAGFFVVDSVSLLEIVNEHL